jgi:hypothetical protein
MKKLLGPVCASVFAAASCLALTTPSLADVVVNNVFSPGSVTVVGPGGYGGSGYDYYDRPRYYRSEYYEPRYYERYSEPRYYERYSEPRYYEPRYYRSGYYGPDLGVRGRYCWVTTDKDRNYGYWDWCR